MERRRVRLEINGVVCGVITQESDEYMQQLAVEVGELMQNIQGASPHITREAAALTAALGYCDDAKKGGVNAKQLQERIDELEIEAEIWQEEKEELLGKVPSEEEIRGLKERIAALERENTALQETAGKAESLTESANRLEDENTAMQQDMLKLAEENRTLKEALEAATAPKPPRRPVEHVNPMRRAEPEIDNLVSFFEQK